MGNVNSVNLKNCIIILNRLIEIQDISLENSIWNDIRNRSRTNNIKNDKNLEFLLYFAKGIIKNICKKNSYLKLIGIIEYSRYYNTINALKKRKDTFQIYLFYRDKYLILKYFNLLVDFKNYILKWIRMNFTNEYKTFLKSGFVLMDEYNKIYDLNRFYEELKFYLNRKLKIYFLIPIEIPIYIFSNDLNSYKLNGNHKGVYNLKSNEVINNYEKKHYTNSVIANFLIELILYCIYCEDEENMNSDELLSLLKIQNYIFDIFFYLSSVDIDSFNYNEFFRNNIKLTNDSNKMINRENFEKNKKEKEYVNIKANYKNEGSQNNTAELNREIVNVIHDNGVDKDFFIVESQLYSPNIFLLEILLKLIKKLYKYNNFLFNKLTYEFLTYLINILYCDKYNIGLKFFDNFKRKCLGLFILCIFYKGNSIMDEKNKNSVNLVKNKKCVPSNENGDNIFLLIFNELYDLNIFNKNENKYYENFRINTIDFKRIFKVFIDSGNYYMNLKNNYTILNFEHAYFLLLYIFLYKNRRFNMYFFSNIDNVQIFILVLYFFTKITHQIIFKNCPFSKNDIYLVTLILIIFVMIIHDTNFEKLFRTEINTKFLQIFDLHYQTNYGNLFVYSILKLAIWNFRTFKNIFILELIYAILINIKISFLLDSEINNLLIKYFSAFLDNIMNIIDIISSPQENSNKYKNYINEYSIQATGILFKSILILLCKNMNNTNIDNLMNVVSNIYEKLNIDNLNNKINKIIYFNHENTNNNNEMFKYILKSLIPYLQYIKICLLYFYNKIYYKNKNYNMDELHILINNLALNFKMFTYNKIDSKNKIMKNHEIDKNGSMDLQNDYIEISNIMNLYPVDLNVIRYKFDEDIYSIFFFFPYIWCVINKLIKLK
ncbi:hypothetical protein PGAL8A_00308200 [Plasmodium gallinaceum]|uniref:Uncharacterized protein n=1 Tax=Plasmodium gallinaceum TaxID=5849 RepID=A0A1J1GTL3_PLAGA|nr:hypothetical protein PGAL8A_00308200 [Plasmodium gallinaceum]CRG95870.1 hypothetical protein PGAL8A_00308200 [Plasmodium gallinaceum]